MDIKKHLSSSLNHLWLMIDENSSDLLDIFISFWILWSIRGMLSSYTTDNNEHVHHKELSDYLIQSMILKFTFSDTADEISSFQKALSSPGWIQCSISCFKQANCILLDSLSSTSSLNTFSHCNITDLYIQNILTHVIEPIHDHLDLLINHIRSQEVDLENNNSFASFRDSMLMLYLNMTVHLPSEFLTDQLLSKVIPFALFAVTSSSNIRTQLAGLHFISIINKNPMRNLELCNLISDSQAEDLFGRLPKLIEASKSDEEVTNYDRKNVLNTLTFIRLTIAQCLLSLIKLPLQIINRHRDITILPLLDQLVDDPNRFVRIEAVRARNLWLI
ncbi:unnamed protein product [Heterobilharzia americana]|nr:unnamed protein product [Heterobilharzia americana]